MINSKRKTKHKKILNQVLIGEVPDVLRKIPSNSVDLTVTSPPYNKRNKTHGWLVTNVKYSHFDDHMLEDEYQSWQVEVLDEIYRLTKPGGSVFYNHKHRWENGKLLHPFSWLEKTKWIVKQEIVWDRAIAANMRGWRFWQVDERIYWLYKPINDYLIGKELEPKHAKLSSIWRIKPAARSEEHPALFPLELPVRAIYSVMTKKGVVLDPFCGTGTTLVAAKLLGHNYIGVDISPDYVKIAKNRLKKAKAETQILKNEKEKHVINDPFVARKKRGTISWPYGPKNGNGDDK